jgi:hypothetical protein
MQELEGCLDSGNVCMTGQALWALGELWMTGAAERMRGFLNDKRETWIFENEQISMKSIGGIAGEALRKMELQEKPASG